MTLKPGNSRLTHFPDLMHFLIPLLSLLPPPPHLPSLHIIFGHICIAGPQYKQAMHIIFFFIFQLTSIHTIGLLYIYIDLSFWIFSFPVIRVYIVKLYWVQYTIIPIGTVELYDIVRACLFLQRRKRGGECYWCLYVYDIYFHWFIFWSIYVWIYMYISV